MTKCFHVTTTSGEVYGVAATTGLEAKLLVQQRLAGEQSSDAPATAVRVGSWTAPFGTVLHY